MMSVNVWWPNIFIIISMLVMLFSGLSILLSIKIVESKLEGSQWILFIWIDDNLGTVSVSLVLLWIPSARVVRKKWHLIFRLIGVFRVYLCNLLKWLKSLLMRSINPWDLLSEVDPCWLLFNIDRTPIDIMQSIIEYSLGIPSWVWMSNRVQISFLLDNFL